MRQYEPALQAEWNAFIDASKNGVFLFRREYMEYHSDRFRDHSLMFYDGERLVALIPGNLADDATFVSHGGLTFGGVVTDARMRAGTMLGIFEAMLLHFDASGVRRVVYKAVPHIYHRMPAEEDLYALFRCGAVLARRDIAFTIEAGNAPQYTKGRRYCVNKGRQSGVTLERSEDFDAFMAIEEAHLAERYNARPVHTAAELRMLSERVPGHIRLYVARHEGEVVAGTIIYLSERVAHTQYIGSTARGRDLCAPDALMDWLLREEFAGVRYFDFGISTERAGRWLNAGLAENKESYGGRGIAYDAYEVEVQEGLARLREPS